MIKHYVTSHRQLQLPIKFCNIIICASQKREELQASYKELFVKSPFTIAAQKGLIPIVPHFIDSIPRLSH